MSKNESSGQNGSQMFVSAEFGDYARGELDERDPEHINWWAGQADTRSDVALLNHLKDIWKLNDHPAEFEETSIFSSIFTNSNTLASHDNVNHGNTSAMKAQTGRTDNTRDAGDVVPTIVEYLSYEGTIAMLCGPPGSGKTSIMLDIMRYYKIRTGGHVFTNIGWDGADAITTNDQEMLSQMAGVKGPTLGGIDESNKGGLTGKGTDKKTANEFQRRMTMVRKQESEHGRYAKRGSVLTVSHNWSEMNKQTREMATFVIQKPSQKQKDRVTLYTSEGGEETRTKIGEFQGLTDTRESYDEHESSEFHIVLDDDAEDDQDADPMSPERREAIKTAIRANQPWSDSDGMSYREIAPIVGKSKSWVGDRCREWQDGQYRNLVDTPNGGNA